MLRTETGRTEEVRLRTVVDSLKTLGPRTERLNLRMLRIKSFRAVAKLKRRRTEAVTVVATGVTINAERALFWPSLGRGTEAAGTAVLLDEPSCVALA